MIHINGLNVGSRLLPLSFQCNEGEIWHVLGPNGSGKSTLLAAIAGVLDCQGEIEIDGTSVRQASLEDLARCRAYLSQSDKPVFNLDVCQYLSLSLPEGTHENHHAVNDAIATLTRLLCIEDKLHRSIHQLSGGEWQRVRLAGSCLQIWPALNPDARLLILDEPAAPLDIAQETLLYNLIHDISARGICIIMANHDLNRLLHHADKALLLDGGVVQKMGEVQEVLSAEQLTQVFRTQVRSVDVDGKQYLIFD